MTRRFAYMSAGRESGMAILTVLLVLLALLVMTTPFLMTARNASRTSTQMADRVQARLALDSAARHARAQLGLSHPAVDPTPYFDDERELALATELDPAFFNQRDTGGVMWDVRVDDISGRIDLNSAPPHVFANMLGASTRVTKPVEKDADELQVSSTSGFPEIGFLWVDRELIGYTSKTTRSFGGLVRGLGGMEDEEGEPMPCGPQPAGTHDAATVVLDERAFAPVLWRILTADGLPRHFDAPEQINDAAQLALGGLDEAALEAFAASGTVYGGVRGGRKWQRAARLITTIQGGIDCEFELDAGRWFNPGTTLQISDGQTTELAVVESITADGLRVSRPFVNDYQAFTAEIRALARRPVNINVASPETLQLLLENLQLAGKNERVTRGEAKDLTALIVESRPFDGLEDFLRRVILPAAGTEGLPADAPVAPAAIAEGGALIDVWDAVAVYMNALNANNRGLAYSSMPFSFTTRDVYDLDLRATVNARSGVERVTRRRRQVELVVPQTELMRLWARQEDFDESLRLDREAPFWGTGPEATTRHDGGNTPPTRFVAHMGTHGGKLFLPGLSEVPEEWGSDAPPLPEHIFASREDQGWAQPLAAQVAEVDLLQGHMEHFRNETRDPEGRFLPDETYQKLTSDEMLEWSDPKALDLLRCLSFSMWIKPRDLGPGTILDVGASSVESDRVTLAIEGPDLVLRVLDAVGDHPLTDGFDEAGEARFARIPFTGVEPDQAVGDPSFTQELDGTYAPGTPVEVLGYSIPLSSDVPSGSSQISGTLGRFAVARVVETTGGQGTYGDAVSEQTLGLEMGQGINGGASQVTGLVLEPADTAMGTAVLGRAFHQGGGYAALVQWMPDSWTNAGGRVTAPNFRSQSGEPLWGIEIIEYSKVDDTTINIVQRAALPAIDGQVPHAFIVNWNPFFFTTGLENWNDDIERSLFVVPISIPAPGAGGLTGFLQSPPEISDFAQITYPDANVENTEWVRYDTVTPNGHLVRNGVDGLEALVRVLTHSSAGTIDTIPDPGPGGGGGGPGGGGIKPKALASAPVPPPATAAQSSQGLSYWQPYVGSEEADEEDWPITRAARSRFQFRGVFGTYQHEHTGGALILPVWRVQQGGWFGGQPGAQDPILVVDEDQTSLGWPGEVHRAYIPREYTVWGWSNNGNAVQGTATGSTVPEDGYLTTDIHVALKAALAAPVVWTPVQSRTQAAEMRLRARILKHPSGERPRIVDRAVVGGTLRGGEVPAMVVDELTFGSTDFGELMDVGAIGQGGHLVLSEALADGDQDFEVWPNQLRLAGSTEFDTANVLDWLPEDAGLLRLGTEIVCYDNLDATGGGIEIAKGGRGLFGTLEENHPLGSTASFLEGFAVSTLTAAIDAGDDFLPLEDLDQFPMQGTVLIDDELIHYTRQRTGGLEMPRASTVAGEMNRKGGGVFRGRYGTTPAGHVLGTPVILFPFRYWDRQVDEFDGPELSYFGLCLDQPNAFWRSVFWQAEEVDGGEIYVLQRTVDPGHDRPPPWDGDPDETPGLTRYEIGMPAGDVNPIGEQADMLEWRVFVRFPPNAFDAVTGLSHGWKRVPRLRVFGVEFLGPSQVLRRIDG